MGSNHEGGGRLSSPPEAQWTSWWNINCEGFQALNCNSWWSYSRYAQSIQIGNTLCLWLLHSALVAHYKRKSPWKNQRLVSVCLSDFVGLGFLRCATLDDTNVLRLHQKTFRPNLLGSIQAVNLAYLILFKKVKHFKVFIEKNSCFELNYLIIFC